MSSKINFGHGDLLHRLLRQVAAERSTVQPLRNFSKNGAIVKIILSSGHGKYIRGAAGPEPWGLDEVDEARRVVEEVRNWLTVNGHEVVTFHDDTSTTQDENLKTIVNFHNSQTRDLDGSIHFNAYIPTDGGRGVEVLFLTLDDVATKVAQAISEATGLINRGPKKRSDLYFLNKTEAPAILIETCFVDAAADVEAYQSSFEAMCQAIANVAPAPEQFDSSVLRAKGKVSWFGGPDDMGVSPSEGLAFLYDVDDKPPIFLREQPPNTTGLARRLDADNAYYVAMRWDYDQFPKDQLAGYDMALVRAPKTGRQVLCHPADWGPHVDTSRVADVSPATLRELQIETDDTVLVIYPAGKRRA